MSTEKTPNLGLNKWAGTDNVRRSEFVENFDALDKEVGQQNYKKVKSLKDADDVFTVEEWYRKTDDTLFRRFVLSGGTAPRYALLTMTEYLADGITALPVKTWALAYDADGDLVSVDPNE